MTKPSVIICIVFVHSVYFNAKKRYANKNLNSYQISEFSKDIRISYQFSILFTGNYYCIKP